MLSLQSVLILCSAGLAVAGPTPHIVGGFDIDIRKAPYQAAIVFPFVCGAAIISDKYLLTTAHCCTRLWNARLGSNYHDKNGTVISIERNVIHPLYNKGFDYDVCIMISKETLKFGDTIKPIPIAKTEPKPGSIVRASGWGSMREGGEISPTLKAVDIPVTNRTYCKNAYDYLSDRLICAGVEGKDTCQGDSGGPLVYQGKLVGLAAYGEGCGRKNYPGVYALLTNREMRAFIKTVTGI